MCVRQPPVSVYTQSDAISMEAGQIGSHFESLLLTATIISTMGNTQLSGIPNHRARSASSPSSSMSWRSNSESNTAHRYHQNMIQRLCSLSFAILGGPLPPSPGLIPVCWDELVDWTEEASSLTEVVRRRRHSSSRFLGPRNSKAEEGPQTIQFIPYVSYGASDEKTLDRLPTLSYMEKVQFYQESVVIAVMNQDTTEVICLISLFQFCRYFTLVRRLAESQECVAEGIGTTYPSTHEPSLCVLSELRDENEEDKPLHRNPMFDLNASEPSNKNDEESLHECVICCDKTEDFVLVCCSHALCSSCEKQWVRKRLQCPFCRKSFSSVREAVQTQWQLRVTAVPSEQILSDIQCLEQKIEDFWKPMMLHAESGSNSACTLRSILAENYVRRRQRTIQTTQGDDYVLVGH